MGWDYPQAGGTSLAGGVLGSVFKSTASAYATASLTPVAMDSTNLNVQFTTNTSGKGSTQVIVLVWGALVTPTNFGEIGLVNHGTTTIVPGSQMQDIASGGLGYFVCIPVPVIGLAPGTAFSWDLAFDAAGNSGSISIHGGGSGGINGILGMVVIGV